MSTVKFYDVIEFTKVTSCSSCSTFIYTLPFPVDVEVEQSFLPIGTLKYDLSKYRIVKIDNDAMQISGRIGTNKITVKFKQDVATNKNLFELHLAAYAEIKTGLKIEVN